MPKIKAVSATFNNEGTMYVIDDQGQVWMRSVMNNTWSIVDLPDAIPTSVEEMYGEANDFFKGSRESTT